MSFIRTVLGDLPADQLGACYAHEHIIIDPSFTTFNEPAFLLDDVEKATRELLLFKSKGGSAMIDSMPCGGGRNVVKLAEISQRSGVKIVCPTGLHLEKYYPPGHWSSRYSEEELAALFIDDIEEGIDAHDYSGPVVDRTPHQAGLIKIASGKDHLTRQQQKVFRAAARAHVRTGCPILTHTEQGTAGLEQIDLLAEWGVNPAHVVLSHTDRLPEVAYHEQLLKRGVFLEYDSAFRWPENGPNPTLELLVELAPRYPNQLMLGMDAARRRYWTSYGGKPGLTFLLTDFIPRLRQAGLSDALLHDILVTNPARAYIFSQT